MNKVILIGRITKDIELKYTTSNIAVAQFTIAVTRNFKNADGEYETDFINCVAYSNTAELLDEYVKKGDKLGIEGRIQTRSFLDKENNKRHITEVIVSSIEFLEQRKEEQKEEQSNIEEPADPFNEFGTQVQADLEEDDNYLE